MYLFRQVGGPVGKLLVHSVQVACTSKTLPNSMLNRMDHLVNLNFLLLPHVYMYSTQVPVYAYVFDRRHFGLRPVGLK